MACEVRGDGATSVRPGTSGETWEPSGPVPIGHLTPAARRRRAARRSVQRDRRRVCRRDGTTDGQSQTNLTILAKQMESIQEQMGQVAKGLQSLAEREDKLTYEWQEWRRRNEMRRIGEQTAQEARQREERRRSWKEVATMAAEVAITRMTQKIQGWCAAKQAARSGKEGVARRATRREMATAAAEAAQGRMRKNGIKRRVAMEAARCGSERAEGRLQRYLKWKHGQEQQALALQALLQKCEEMSMKWVSEFQMVWDQHTRERDGG